MRQVQMERERKITYSARLWPRSCEGVAVVNLRRRFRRTLFVEVADLVADFAVRNISV